MNRDEVTDTTYNGYPSGQELNKNDDVEYFRNALGEILNVGTVYQIDCIMKEYVILKLKFISDNEKEWKWPDFTNKELDSTRILDVIVSKLHNWSDSQKNDYRRKCNFWTTYRKGIKKMMNYHQSNARNKMKYRILEG